MVPKQKGESQKTPGGRVGKTKTGNQTALTCVRLSIPARDAHRLASPLRTFEFLSQTIAACTGTLQCTRHIWNVLFVLNRESCPVRCELWDSHSVYCCVLSVYTDGKSMLSRVCYMLQSCLNVLKMRAHYFWPVNGLYHRI